MSTEAAWAAGFFDGEGNVGFFKHSSRKQHTFYRCQCQIAQLDREVLDRFARVVGVGKVTGPYTHKRGYVAKKPWNAYFRWGVTAVAEVERVHAVLEPYLSTIKRQQFADTFSRLAVFRAGAHERHVAAGKIAAAVRWGHAAA